MWSLPAGIVEPSEQPATAALRVLQEETESPPRSSGSHCSPQTLTWFTQTVTAASSCQCASAAATSP